MEKICVHIGLALFAIKKICLSHETCQDCPLRHCCRGIADFAHPVLWDSNRFPNIEVVMDLTTGRESETIELAPQIE